MEKRSAVFLFHYLTEYEEIIPKELVSRLENIQLKQTSSKIVYIHGIKNKLLKIFKAVLKVQKS